MVITIVVAGLALLGGVLTVEWPALAQGHSSPASSVRSTDFRLALKEPGGVPAPSSRAPYQARVTRSRA